MSKISYAYDNATYVTRSGVNLGINTAGSGSVYPQYTAFTAMKAYSATFTVNTAGTSATTAIFVISKVSNTTVTALATATVGQKVAGSVVNVELSATAGGVSLIQGDQITVVGGTDVVSVCSAALEVAVTPTSNITA